MVVSLATLQHVLSASAFVACVTPTAPGVNEATFASEPEPTIQSTDSTVTGIANAARKTPITMHLHSHDPSDGRKASLRYTRGRARMTPPCLACCHSFLTWRQKIRPTRKMRKPPPATTTSVNAGWAEMLPRFTSNEFGTDRKR